MKHHGVHHLIPSIEALTLSVVGVALALPLCFALLAGTPVSAPVFVLWAVGTTFGATAFVIERRFVPREPQEDEAARLTMGAAGLVTLLGAVLSLFAFAYAAMVTA